MRSLNRVTLIGHLAGDVELRQTKTGKTVGNFAVAINRFTTAEGEKREIADFHRVVAWGRLAEICNDYLAKGSAVYLEGRLINNSFEKDGVKRYKTEVVAEDVKILTWKKGKDGKEQTGVEDLKEAEAVVA